MSLWSEAPRTRSRHVVHRGLQALYGCTARELVPANGRPNGARLRAGTALIIHYRRQTSVRDFLPMSTSLARTRVLQHPGIFLAFVTAERIGRIGVYANCASGSGGPAGRSYPEAFRELATAHIIGTVGAMRVGLARRRSLRAVQGVPPRRGAIHIQSIRSPTALTRCRRLHRWLRHRQRRPGARSRPSTRFIDGPSTGDRAGHG
jgi:hypothetical protein